MTIKEHNTKDCFIFSNKIWNILSERGLQNNQKHNPLTTLERFLLYSINAIDSCWKYAAYISTVYQWIKKEHENESEVLYFLDDFENAYEMAFFRLDFFY